VFHKKFLWILYRQEKLFCYTHTIIDSRCFHTGQHHATGERRSRGSPSSSPPFSPFFRMRPLQSPCCCFPSHRSPERLYGYFQHPTHRAAWMLVWEQESLNRSSERSPLPTAGSQKVEPLQELLCGEIATVTKPAMSILCRHREQGLTNSILQCFPSACSHPTQESLHFRKHFFYR
jgi:hypothetical protein